MVGNECRIESKDGKKKKGVLASDDAQWCKVEEHERNEWKRTRPVGEENTANMKKRRGCCAGGQ